MKNETLEFNTTNGATTAFVAAPENVDQNTKTVILIQEYWGVNDNIKDIANRYAAENFLAIVPDLYRGALTDNPDEAKKLMNALEISDGVDTIKNAVQTAREKYGVGKFAISGFCMGGTFALRAACELPDFSAAAPFYGDVPPDDVLKNLKTPVLFIAATQDGWINPQKVEELKDSAKKLELPIETISYEADHAFFNNTRPDVYDAEAAADAWQRVLQLFGEKL